jgi:hypothetical protein
MEPEGSSPHSQEPATCPYPEPDWSSPGPPPPNPTSRRSILIVIMLTRLQTALPRYHILKLQVSYVNMATKTEWKMEFILWQKINPTLQ